MNAISSVSIDSSIVADMGASSFSGPYVGSDGLTVMAMAGIKATHSKDSSNFQLPAILRRKPRIQMPHDRT